ncbi:hypothetical protein ACB094_04G040600 [Castanea mollissima]
MKFLNPSLALNTWQWFVQDFSTSFPFAYVLLKPSKENLLYHSCLDNGNYTSNSTYKANLNQLLSSLSSNTEIDYGFYNFSYGQNPDKVYSIGVCNGDVKPDNCRSCLNNATNLHPQLCPNQKEAIVWYGGCMLRHSFRDIFNIKETSPTFCQYNSISVSANYLDQFNQVLRNLLDSKRIQAAAGGSLRKFAVGNATAPYFQTPFSLAQCTPDLPEQNCSDCLVEAFGNISQCGGGKQGGRFHTPSCYFIFEIYPFYDTSYPPSPPVSSPPLNNTSATIGNENNKSRTVIVVVPIIAFVVLIMMSICIYVRVKKPREKPKGEFVDEIGSVESLQLGFDAVKVATDNFSDANKLGQGGFGVVYKGKLFYGQVIAVKRLSTNSRQGDLKFKNEVQLMAKLQHRNLVRFLGFCLERNERLLVYEFVPNRSVDYFIFDPIIGGIARGLLYLHEDSQLRIIHRDLKASNILLDSKMN